MTKDQTKAAAEVMLAWVEGKPVQYRALGNTVWHDIYTTESSWAWHLFEYRIKPEPREWWMRQHGESRQPCTSCGLFTCYDDANRPSADSQVNVKINEAWGYYQPARVEDFRALRARGFSDKFHAAIFDQQVCRQVCALRWINDSPAFD